MADEAAGNISTLPASEVKHRPSIELTPIVRSPVIIQTTLSDPQVKAEKNRPEVIYAPDKNGRQMSCLKYGFAVFTSLIWLLGLVITAVGIWMLVDPSFWTFQLKLDMKEFQTAAIVAIAVGVFIVFIGFVGTCGAFRESTCLLSFYLIISLIILLLEAVAVGIVWAAVSNKETQKKISDYLTTALEDVREKDDARYFLDFLQTNLKCCGIDNADKYLGDEPRSCRNPTTLEVYREGCVEKLMHYLKEKAAILGGITIGLLLLQVGAIVVTICLLCIIRQGTKAVF